jgi:hypothetical protein
MIVKIPINRKSRKSEEHAQAFNSSFEPSADGVALLVSYHMLFDYDLLGVLGVHWLGACADRDSNNWLAVGWWDIWLVKLPLRLPILLRLPMVALLVPPLPVLLSSHLLHGLYELHVGLILHPLHFEHLLLIELPIMANSLSQLHHGLIISLLHLNNHHLHFLLLLLVDLHLLNQPVHQGFVLLFEAFGEVGLLLLLLVFHLGYQLFLLLQGGAGLAFSPRYLFVYFLLDLFLLAGFALLDCEQEFILVIRLHTGDLL